MVNMIFWTITIGCSLHVQTNPILDLIVSRSPVLFHSFILVNTQPIAMAGEPLLFATISSRLAMIMFSLDNADGKFLRAALYSGREKLRP